MIFWNEVGKRTNRWFEPVQLQAFFFKKNKFKKIKLIFFISFVLCCGAWSWTRFLRLWASRGTVPLLRDILFIFFYKNSLVRCSAHNGYSLWFSRGLTPAPEVPFLYSAIFWYHYFITKHLKVNKKIQ